MLKDAARLEARRVGPLRHFHAAARRRIDSVERVRQSMALSGIARGAEVHVSTLRALPPDSANCTSAAAFAHDLRMPHTDGAIVHNAQVKGVLVATAVVRALPVVPLKQI